MIDIIIPILNEEKILTEKSEYYRTLKQFSKITFVDGGSTDQTVAIAKEFGDVICSPVGRATQKVYGVKNTHARHILFLHVDTFINEKALTAIEQTLEGNSVGGCMTMHIQDASFIFRIYEMVVNFRARAIGVIDGDLGMFVRRDIFEELGGFDLFPIMEDILFSKRLRKAGRTDVLKYPINVSSRKWHERGFWRTFFEYTLAYGQLWSGRLKSSYNNEKYCQAK